MTPRNEDRHPDTLLAQLAQVDQRIDEQTRAGELAERELFSGRAEGERRQFLTLSIALRDELLEELRARRALLASLLAEASGPGRVDSNEGR